MCIVHIVAYLQRNTLLRRVPQNAKVSKKKLPKLFQFCFFVNNFTAKRAIIQITIIQQDFQNKKIYFLKIIDGDFLKLGYGDKFMQIHGFSLCYSNGISSPSLTFKAFSISTELHIEGQLLSHEHC